jgi:hypothetical protein
MPLKNPLKRNCGWPLQKVLEIPTADWSGIGLGLSSLMLLAALYVLLFYPPRL